MSTNSHIGKKLADGSIKYIYCHWDGYLNGVGKVLKKHYTDEAKIDALLELGDLSSLGPEIGECQDFENRSTHNKGWCLAYGRDRNEKDTEARIGGMNDFTDQSYNYLWEDGTWKCFVYEGELKF